MARRSALTSRSLSDGCDAQPSKARHAAPSRGQAFRCMGSQNCTLIWHNQISAHSETVCDRRCAPATLPAQEAIDFLPETQARQVKSALNCSNRLAGDFSDLLVGEAYNVLEQEDLAIVLRQPVGCLLDRAAQVGLQRLVIGDATPIGLRMFRETAALVESR